MFKIRKTIKIKLVNKNYIKLGMYPLFKSELIPESYLDQNNIHKYLILLCRCTSHQLAIEQGRHLVILMLMADIYCVLCNAGNYIVVVDEYHCLRIFDDYKFLRH